jgi:dienelactone hydrolase
MRHAFRRISKTALWGVGAGIALMGLATAMSGAASADMVDKKISYKISGKNYVGVLVYDDSVASKRPAVLMAPNWRGVTKGAVIKAKLLAGRKYVIFVADMYGAKIRPKNNKEASKAAGLLRKNIPLMRTRINKAMDVLLAQGTKLCLTNNAKTAAIGFCFGGGNVLELARSGRDVQGIVSFHGDLKTATPEDAKNIKGKVLVLHGADDPFQPKANRDALEAEMRAAKVDWQLIAFGGAVHSFTDPDAKYKGKAEYNEKVAKRAYAIMYDFLAETL